MDGGKKGWGISMGRCSESGEEYVWGAGVGKEFLIWGKSRDTIVGEKSGGSFWSKEECGEEFLVRGVF